MCNRMKANNIGIAMRLRNISPSITYFPEIEVVADSQALFDQMLQIKARLCKTMQNALGNDDIRLNIRLAQGTEVKKYLSRRERLDELRHTNPAVDSLCDKFKLILEN